MTQPCLHLPCSDEMLVAYLDNQLSLAEREQFTERLRHDEILSERLALLSHSSLPFHDAFEPMLADAPLADLQARLDAIPEPARPAGVNRRQLLAAAVSFLAVGVLVGRYALPSTTSEKENNWRSLVAQYMSLYSAETLADINDSPARQQAELQRVKNNLGIALTSAQLALPGVELKNARILSYDQYRIAQIAYLDPQYGPLALCITRTSEHGNTAQASEVRRGMNVVYWCSKGYDFMLIGHNPPDQMAAHGEHLFKALT
ncbi:membrane protein [Enterobacterales bacterium]|nr:membrane protein [Enterobacterales bacterium]